MSLFPSLEEGYLSYFSIFFNTASMSFNYFFAFFIRYSFLFSSVPCGNNYSLYITEFGLRYQKTDDRMVIDIVQV